MGRINLDSGGIKDAGKQLISDGSHISDVGGSVAAVQGEAGACGHQDVVHALTDFAGRWSAYIAQVGYQVSDIGLEATQGALMYDTTETHNAGGLGGGPH